MKPFPFLGIVNLQKKLKPVTERSYKELTPLSPSKTTDLTSVTQRQTKTAKLQHLFLKTKISHSTTKNSSAQNGIIIGYSANTNQGIVRSYNEDRVTIILNFIQPKEKNLPYWPKCSFFGLYDGHGGSLCAEYLRDYLHHFVTL
jgi:protein phosphatase 2C family protein 2/3